ncbi:uncharacterized protein YqhL-like [Rhincodon typus]|uniref:uncharacterized protein YqhL-like n=1 Tax=Rhincodon typus TaxID=259920 RepID=UPI00202FD344|nr:uncharacterized protein YqhL-like [Rhincodon typus]
MEPVTEWIRHWFPTVGNVCPSQLEQLVKENRQQILLLDVRSPAEYEVSHLQGAVRIDPETTDVDHLVKDLGLAGSMDKTVVCYCTAGYHGSEMAEKLRRSLTQGSEQEGPGSLKVYNLEGGLVKWANESKPMVDRLGQATNLVHPYNNMWAYLVKPEFRAPL